MNNKDDKQMIVLSIVVAIIMRAFVMTTTNPSLSKTIRYVPLTIRNLETIENEGYEVVNQEDVETVNVKVEGNRDSLLNLTNNDLVASVNLQAPTEGIKSLNIDIDTPSGVRVDEIEPRQVDLKIEKIIEKELPVTFSVMDTLKEGRILEINENYPQNIVVKGSRTIVDKVKKIQVNIDKESYLNGKIHNVKVKALDSKGEEVNNVTLSSDEVSVSYIVFETKEVEVELVTKGNLASDYELISKEVLPSKLIIKGENEVISKIEKIETQVLNISNLKKNTSGEIELNLPDGVEVYDGDNKVNVSLEIEKKETE